MSDKDTSSKRTRPPWDTDDPPQRQHYVDGVAFSNATSDPQNGADIALAVVIGKGCLGITGEKDEEHVWETGNKAICAVYFTSDGDNGVTMKTWVDAVITTNGDANDDKKLIEIIPIASDSDFGHCIGTSVDGTLNLKGEALERFCKEILFPHFGGASRPQIDFPQIPSTLALSDITDDRQRNKTIFTVTSTGETWEFTRRTKIEKGKIAGTNAHTHPI